MFPSETASGGSNFLSAMFLFRKLFSRYLTLSKKSLQMFLLDISKNKEYIIIKKSYLESLAIKRIHFLLHHRPP